MKTLISAALLSLGPVIAVGQLSPPEPFGSGLQIGYVRETLKLHDLQASPMRYVANLNGLRLSYTRQTTRNQWRASLEAGLGDLVAPGLGIRPLKFSPEQSQSLWLVPTLYRGQLSLDYRRLMSRTAQRSTWLGVGLRETVGYADGLVLSTWAFNTADLRLQYQTRLTLGKRHALVVDAALPVLAAVSRMPYSNVVSEPDRSDAAAFFGHTQLATLNQYLNPELGLAYRFGLSRRVGFGVDYRYQWLRYPNPRPIWQSTHAGSACFTYSFQQQSR